MINLSDYRQRKEVEKPTRGGITMTFDEMMKREKRVKRESYVNGMILGGFLGGLVGITIHAYLTGTLFVGA